jgi:hypothetical protein
MKELVQECISYVITNLHDVVRLPIDMSCLNEKVVKMIAEQTPMDKLITLLDKRDKLSSKLFKKKLEKLLFLSMLKDDDLYDHDVHHYLWRHDTFEELKKAAHLMKNKEDKDICFTVDAF